LVRYLVLRLGLEAAEDGVLVGEGVERHGCCSPRGAAGGSDRIRSRIDRRRRSGWGGEEADDDGERGRWEDPTRPDAAEYIANQTQPNRELAVLGCWRWRGRDDRGERDSLAAGFSVTNYFYFF
jgi:hypothetical protein